MKENILTGKFCYSGELSHAELFPMSTYECTVISDKMLVDGLNSGQTGNYLTLG